MKNLGLIKIEAEDFKKVTPLDVELATIYYPILIEQARQKETISYANLLKKAKGLNPNNQNVQKAIPVGTGRRLCVVTKFTQIKEIPDISSLVINKATNEVGEGYSATYDPIEKRNEVFNFDWSGIKAEFDIYIESVKKILQQNEKVLYIDKNLVLTLYEGFVSRRDNKLKYPLSTNRSNNERLIIDEISKIKKGTPNINKYIEDIFIKFNSN